MLLRILKYNTTAGYLIVPLLAVIAWLPSLIEGQQNLAAYDLNMMPLYELLAVYIERYHLIAQLLALAVTIFTGFYLIRLNNKFLFLKERTLFPTFFFVVILSSLPLLHRMHPALIGMLFFLAAFDKILDSYKTERLSYSFYEAPFLIGAGSLLYFNLIWFIILVWVSLLIMRPVIWREWVFTILGLATPWLFFLFADYFLNDSLEWSTGKIAGTFEAGIDIGYLHHAEKIFLIIVLLLIVAGSRNIISSMPRMKVLSRKIFILFFWIFALTIATYLLIDSAGIELLVLTAMPVAFLLSLLYQHLRKSFWGNTVLWILVAGMLVNAWVPW